MPTSPRIEVSFFLFLSAVVAVLTFFIFQPFISSLFLAIVFTIVFKPCYEALLRMTRGSSILSAVLTVLTIILVIVVPLLFFGFFMFTDAQDFYQSMLDGGFDQGFIQTGVSHMQSFVQQFFPGFTLDVLGFLKQGFGLLVHNLGSLFGKLFSASLGLFIMLLGVFYFLRDGKKFREHLIVLSPLSDTYDRSILARFEMAVNSVVKGALSIALIQGVLSGIGFSIFGVPSPMLWGALAALTALIPGVGTAIVIAPAVIYLFFFGSVSSAVGLLIWGVIAVGLIDNMLAPMLIERDLKIHPFLILLSVLGGLAFFGPVGFLAGPVILALLFALFDILPRLLQKPD